MSMCRTQTPNRSLWSRTGALTRLYPRWLRLLSKSARTIRCGDGEGLTGPLIGMGAHVRSRHARAFSGVGAHPWTPGDKLPAHQLPPKTSEGVEGAARCLIHSNTCSTLYPERSTCMTVPDNLAAGAPAVRPQGALG